MSTETHKLNLRIERLEKAVEMLLAYLSAKDCGESSTWDISERVKQSTLTDSAIKQEAGKREEGDEWHEERLKYHWRNM